MPRLLLQPDRLLDPERPDLPAGSRLLVEDGAIRAHLLPGEPAPEEAEVVAVRGALAPGFLDLHHHGATIFAPLDALASSVRHDAAGLLRHGVTGFLVTSVALPAAELAGFVDACAEALAAGAAADAATPLGLHLEGPWIAPGRAGAQPPRGIRAYTRSEGRELLARGEGLLRMVTLAPEVEGATRLQADLARHGVVGALGHSDASWSDATRVIDAGATHVTHLYNAMSGHHHRRPGLVSVALADDRLSCDLICDGVHVEPRVVAWSARVLGERLVLISDRVEPGPGADFGAGPVRDDGVALRLADGRLAGSRLQLDRAVANLREFAGASLLEAVAACTLRPARVLGLESRHGTLRAGARADFAVLGEDGGVRETWLAGRRAWRAGPA